MTCPDTLLNLTPPFGHHQLLRISKFEYSSLRWLPSAHLWSSGSKYYHCQRRLSRLICIIRRRCLVSKFIHQQLVEASARSYILRLKRKIKDACFRCIPFRLLLISGHVTHSAKEKHVLKILLLQTVKVCYKFCCDVLIFIRTKYREMCKCEWRGKRSVTYEESGSEHTGLVDRQRQQIFMWRAGIRIRLGAVISADLFTDGQPT